MSDTQTEQPRPALTSQHGVRDVPARGRVELCVAPLVSNGPRPFGADHVDGEEDPLCLGLPCPAEKDARSRGIP
jgi:hypothetical protein